MHLEIDMIAIAPIHSSLPADQSFISKVMTVEEWSSLAIDVHSNNL